MSSFRGEREPLGELEVGRPRGGEVEGEDFPISWMGIEGRAVDALNVSS